MKVAVVSGTGTQCGKSTLMLTLSTLFSITQKKTAVLLSTGSMTDVLDMVQYKRSKSVLSSAAVLSSVLRSAQASGKEIYDYGLRIGNAMAYAFDIYDSTYDTAELDDMMLEAIQRFKSDLVLVEVKGDLSSSVNQRVLDTVDCILYLFGVSQKSMKQIEEYKKNMSADIVARTGFVCASYDRNVVDEHKLAKAIGVSVRELLIFPYNSVLQKLAFMGVLEQAAEYIAVGHAEVVNLRIRMLEMMQYLFDTGSWHYIKGVEEWTK